MAQGHLRGIRTLSGWTKEIGSWNQSAWPIADLLILVFDLSRESQMGMGQALGEALGTTEDSRS